MGLGGLPGVILIIAATVLLALVSFNTPLIKSIYFFQASFSSGEYAGTLKLGTMGYCLTRDGVESCVGPKIGYSLDLNTILGISSSTFSIPSAVSKWMSYTLVLHIVALGLGGLGVICGLLDLIPGFSMICFPTFFASICGGVALIALIFDLIMFYMYRAAVNRVSGAQGNVGMAVWMTLAAWLCACFAGCAYGMGRCCCSCGGYGADNKRSWRRDRKRDNDRDRELDAYHRRDEDMRLEALRDENRRKAEQTQAERMPLKEPEDDKYLYDDAGDHIPAVGAGYGRRGPQGNQYQYQPNPYDPNHNQGLSQQEYQYDYSSGVEPSVPYQQDSYNRRDYEPSIATAGAAGVGAGPGGIVPAGKGYDGHNQYDYGQPNYATGSYEQGGYDDHNISGYDQQPQHDGYGNSQGYNDPYAHAQAPQPNNQYSNYASSTNPNPQVGPSSSGVIAGVAAGAAATQQGRDYYASTSDNNSNLNPYYTTGSTESAYPPDPAHLVQHSETYQPYDHDDGLGAIGRAATSPTEAQYPIDPATAAAAAGFNGTYSVVSGISSGSSYSTPASARQSIQTVTSPLPIAPLQPRPQHLANVHRSELLRTPPPNEADEDALSHAPAPPSYGLAVSEGAREYRPIEKSGKI